MYDNLFSSIKSFYKTKPLIFFSILLFLLSFITYINILPNKLFFDDEELIYKNSYVADFKFFPEYFTQNMVAGAGKLSNMYRPVLLISFALDHAIWENNPVGYHLTSIILHSLNTVFVFFLITQIFKNKLTAFLTACLFSIHPIQSEAVIYASGRTDPLFVFFALLTTNCFILFIKMKKNQTLYYLLSLFFSILSVLSKETAIILPMIIVMIYLSLDKEKDWNLQKLFILIQPFFIMSCIYIILRLTLLNFSNTLNFYTEANIYSQNLFVRLFTFTRVYFEYLTLLIFPKDLIIARSIQVISNPYNPYVIAFVLLNSLILFFSIIFRKINKIFLFSIIWFFTSTAPVAGLIPINNIIAEHYLYFPSISFFLIVGYIFNMFWMKSKKISVKYITFFIFITISGLLFARTFIRTFDWRDPITFYTIALKQSPWHIPMRNNLAMAYSEAGKAEIAISEYQNVIKIGDYYPNTHHNLANVYKSLGKYKEAEEEYKKAIAMNSNFYFSFYALADLYKKTGESKKYDEVMKAINEINK